MTQPPTRRWLGPAVALVTLLVGLCAAELLLRAMHPLPDPYAALKEVVQRDFVPSFHAPHERLVVSAEAGIPGMSTSRKTFSTDNVGLRGDSLAMPKPAGEFRIFVIGGSTTECTYLDDSEALPRRIQDHLRADGFSSRQVEVYGAAKSGDNSLDHVAALSQILIHMQPDMIVVFAGINDLSGGIAGVSYEDVISPPRTRIHFADIVKELATESQLARLAYQVLGQRSERQRLEALPLRADVQRLVAIRDSHAVSDSVLHLDPGMYRDNLETLAGTARAHRVPMVFMTQATTWNSEVDSTAVHWHWMTYRRGVTYREDVLDGEMEKYNDVMRQEGAKLGVPVFDLARELPKSTRYIYDDVHFNPAGADTTGVLLASFLVARYPHPDSALTLARSSPYPSSAP